MLRRNTHIVAHFTGLQLLHIHVSIGFWSPIKHRARMLCGESDDASTLGSISSVIAESADSKFVKTITDDHHHRWEGLDIHEIVGHNLKIYLSASFEVQRRVADSNVRLEGEAPLFDDAKLSTFLMTTFGTAIPATSTSRTTATFDCPDDLLCQHVVMVTSW